jgi:hypothetical protein
MLAAAAVLVIDRAAFAWRALFLRRSHRRRMCFSAGGEGLREDVADLIGRSAVVLDDHIGDMAHVTIILHSNRTHVTVWMRNAAHKFKRSFQQKFKLRLRPTNEKPAALVGATGLRAATAERNRPPPVGGYLFPRHSPD